MKIEQVIQLISTQLQLYPETRPMDKNALTYYASAIADIEDEYLIMAFRMHLETNKWFPAVAEIREAAANLAGRKSGIPIPYEAWREVMDHAKTFNSGDNIDQFEWSHVIVKEAARLLGWQDICYTDNLTSIRARYIECYEQLKYREQMNLILSRHIHEFAAPEPKPVLPEPKQSQVDDPLDDEPPDKFVFGYNGFANIPEKAKKELDKRLEKMRMENANAYASTGN